MAKGNPLHGSVAGSYNQKSKDGDTQASNKYGNTFHKPTDAGAGKTQKINQPKDSGA